MDFTRSLGQALDAGRQPAEPADHEADFYPACDRDKVRSITFRTTTEVILAQILPVYRCGHIGLPARIMASRRGFQRDGRYRKMCRVSGLRVADR